MRDESKRPKRWDVAPQEVELMEAAWWEKHSWLEDEYAWVHPPKVRMALRKDYLSQILTKIPPGGTIIDFGCGPGWLAILLAQAGAGRVVGVDNAPAQIEIATRKAKEANLLHIVSFCDNMQDQQIASADALVIHGVLHHLSWSQLDGICTLLSSTLKTGAKIFILEPVLGSRRYGLWALPLKIVRIISTLRRQSAEETHVRAMLEGRKDGYRYPGYGVAPKEMPFEVGELESRLARHFEVFKPQIVLFQSVQPVQELLLWRESNPKIGQYLLEWFLPLYRKWEKLSFRTAPNELWGGWVFCLWEVHVR